MLKDVLQRGYFPRELPTPFTTDSYATTVDKHHTSLPAPFSYNAKKGPKYWSRAFPYNVARRGKIRRALAVPNPVNFYHTAQILCDGWKDLETHFKKYDQTLSRPVFSKTGRAFDWEKGFGKLALSKVDNRNASRFVVQTDIASFYPTIYTHSIPWALHTKVVAKAHKNFSDNLGNKIDHAIRCGQEGQTIGIPVGPDTSFLAAEIVMTAIDEMLIAAGCSRYFRYMDDFEFACQTSNEADQVIGQLQEVLTEFEIALSAPKTKVIELPCPIDPPWLKELQGFEFRTTDGGQARDLSHYFDASIERFLAHKNDAVIKYAIRRTSSVTIRPANWNLFESLLLQWAIAESGVLPTALDFIKKYHDLGYTINKDKVKDALAHLIQMHAPLGHTGEIAWAVWGMILFKIPFDDAVVAILADINSSVVALVSLDAQSQSLISKSHTFSKWAALMTEDELQGSNWLLAYEAIVKGWLPPLGGSDYTLTAPGFGFLRKNDVYFYDVGRTATYKPTVQYSAAAMLGYE